MKRFPEFNPRWAPDRRPAFTTTTELDGLVSAGMKKEALALARRLLKAPTITAPVFADATSAILILADRFKAWKPLVESAYERVSKRQRGSVRFWIMSIRNVCRDHEGVLRQVPKRFTGEFALRELIWVIVPKDGKAFPGAKDWELHHQLKKDGSLKSGRAGAYVSYVRKGRQHWRRYVVPKDPRTSA